MPLISVIVPVYKVEPYLRRCVDSILAQTFADFELILVDDGSPDNCGAICDEYAKFDQRISVIYKANGGLPDARNTGLDYMSGDYTGYCAADIETSVRNHLIGFAAEKARHNDTVEYVAKFAGENGYDY